MGISLADGDDQQEFVMKFIVAAVLAAVLAGGAFAQDDKDEGPLKLMPASPQPDAAALKQGLKVRYADGDIRFLAEGDHKRNGAEAGPPLTGFDYMDMGPGEKALTSDRMTRVLAFIEGYIRFPEPGMWKVQFHSNDGVKVVIGNRQVYKHDGRHGCETLGWDRELEVPVAGWYEVKVDWFQRYQSSCLMMEWEKPGGNMSWTPNSATAYLP